MRVALSPPTVGTVIFGLATAAAQGLNAPPAVWIVTLAVTVVLAALTVAGFPPVQRYVPWTAKLPLAQIVHQSHGNDTLRT